MPLLRSGVVCLALTTLACNGGTSPPTAPRTITDTPPLPPPSGQQPTDGIQLTVGEVVVSHVNADDRLCSGGYPYRCRYYRLVAPSDGFLETTLAWSPLATDPYPLDMGVIDQYGRMWAAAPGQGTERAVSLRVTGGAVYVIEIWSAAAPGEQFELKTAIR